jgi:hypothetical protein
VAAQDFSGAVVWSHPGQPWGSGETVVVIRGEKGLKLHDLQTGAEIDASMVPLQGLHVGFCDRPTTWYYMTPAAGPGVPAKLTAYLPSK